MNTFRAQQSQPGEAGIQEEIRKIQKVPGFENYPSCLPYKIRRVLRFVKLQYTRITYNVAKKYGSFDGYKAGFEAYIESLKRKDEWLAPCSWKYSHLGPYAIAYKRFLDDKYEKKVNGRGRIHIRHHFDHHDHHAIDAAMPTNLNSTANPTQKRKKRKRQTDKAPISLPVRRKIRPNKRKSRGSRTMKQRAEETRDITEARNDLQGQDQPGSPHPSAAVPSQTRESVHVAHINAEVESEDELARVWESDNDFDDEEDRNLRQKIRKRAHKDAAAQPSPEASQRSLSSTGLQEVDSAQDNHNSSSFELVDQGLKTARIACPSHGQVEPDFAIISDDETTDTTTNDGTDASGISGERDVSLNNAVAGDRVEDIQESHNVGLSNAVLTTTTHSKTLHSSDRTDLCGPSVNSQEVNRHKHRKKEHERRRLQMKARLARKDAQIWKMRDKCAALLNDEVRVLTRKETQLEAVVKESNNIEQELRVHEAHLSQVHKSVKSRRCSTDFDANESVTSREDFARACQSLDQCIARKELKDNERRLLEHAVYEQRKRVKRLKGDEEG